MDNQGLYTYAEERWNRYRGTHHHHHACYPNQSGEGGGVYIGGIDRLSRRRVCVCVCGHGGLSLLLLFGLVVDDYTSDGGLKFSLLKVEWGGGE